MPGLSHSGSVLSPFSLSCDLRQRIFHSPVCHLGLISTTATLIKDHFYSLPTCSLLRGIRPPVCLFVELRNQLFCCPWGNHVLFTISSKAARCTRCSGFCCGEELQIPHVVQNITSAPLLGCQRCLRGPQMHVMGYKFSPPPLRRSETEMTSLPAKQMVL